MKVKPTLVQILKYLCDVVKGHNLVETKAKGLSMKNRAIAMTCVVMLLISYEVQSQIYYDIDLPITWVAHYEKDRLLPDTINQTLSTLVEFHGDQFAFVTASYCLPCKQYFATLLSKGIVPAVVLIEDGPLSRGMKGGLFYHNILNEYKAKHPDLKVPVIQYYGIREKDLVKALIEHMDKSLVNGTLYAYPSFYFDHNLIYSQEMFESKYGTFLKQK